MATDVPLSSKSVLVTGAAGFVGRALTGALAQRCDKSVHLAVRPGGNAECTPDLPIFECDLVATSNWRPALEGIDVVVHSAARVHVMADRERDPLAAFRRINVEGTLNLARQATLAGVRRFIFISSIKVNGEGTKEGCPYLADGPIHPVDYYGISKMEAELGLREISASTGMDVVIIRPPLVYGPGVRANFQSLIRAVSLGIPLPFAAIHNRRSLVGLDNLIDLIATCIDHPNAANQTFLVSDGEDMSFSELIQRIAKAMDKSILLVPVPSWLLEIGGRLVGQEDLIRRLCGNLQVDILKTMEMLRWRPPVSIDEELRRTVAFQKNG